MELQSRNLTPEQQQHQIHQMLLSRMTAEQKVQLQQAAPAEQQRIMMQQYQKYVDEQRVQQVPLPGQVSSPAQQSMAPILIPASALQQTNFAADEHQLNSQSLEEYRRKEEKNSKAYMETDYEVDTDYSCAESCCSCISRMLFPCCCCGNIVQLMEYERGVLLRYGKKSHKGVLKGGMHFLLPYVETMMKISIQEERLDIRKQSVITKEGFSLVVDGMVYFKVVDAHLALLNVQNVRRCIEMLSECKLRECIGIHTFEELTTQKDKMVASLQKVLDVATDPWGIKVLRVELSEIVCPPAMKAAMASEGDARIAATQFIIAAERDAKARMIQASASPVLVEAERKAKAAIIEAEGIAKATVARAQGEKNAAILLKEAAEKMAGNPNAMQLRYLQTLPAMANATIVGGSPSFTLQL